MKKLKTSIVFTLLFVCAFKYNGHSQFYKDMSVGLNAGAYVYQGDLSEGPAGSFKTAKPGISVFAIKPLNNFLAARLQISIANLKGDESKYSKPDYRQDRNFAFTTPVKEFSGQLVWNLRGNNQESGIMPYLFAGAAVSFFNIQRDYSRLNPEVFGPTTEVYMGLQQDIVHGTPRNLLTVPAGVGAMYSISDRLSINLETSYRFVFDDYLDGYSKAVNPKSQDHFHSTSAGLVYKFGQRSGSIACPTISKRKSY